MSHSPHIDGSTECGGLHGLEFMAAVTDYEPRTATTTSDENLAVAALADPDAFAELYDRFSGRIHLYLMRRLGNPNDASDLTQQTFLKAFASLRTFNPERGTFAAWLFTIARNSAHTNLRRNRHTNHWVLRPEDETPTSREE
jgi:DNA-directed RNA polymerase specialized sigma24 family protein